MSANVLANQPATASGQWRTVLRHRWPLRLMHWINLACMLALVGSGLQILNAHPALYWGEASHFETPLASTGAVTRNGEMRGITKLGNTSFDTTGLLGAANNPNGVRVRAVAPSWAMIPGSRNLAVGRRWHFFFGWAWVINGCVYLLWSLATRHLQRDLAMQRRDWREIPKSILDHLRFRHPQGEAAARYNPLQKLAYLGVIFGLTPLIVLTGLSMSPQMDSVMGGFIELVGGRQSARTLHFIAMSLFLLFAIVHVLMVVYAGPINEMRSMISGRFRIRNDPASLPTSTEGATGHE
ncbi:MAG: cytochrome b/b6 domain-containing protein [Pseudomonadota bacterium]|nr:cytochrome b/b6 domain-containing protein [Pseudomonadota bacterium]